MSDQKREAGPVSSFIGSLFELDNFIEVTLEGHGYSTVAPRVTKYIRKISERRTGSDHPVADEEIYRKRLERQKELKSFAQREVEKGHPYLFSLAVVKLWSILEAAVDEVILSLLKEGNAETSEAVMSLEGELVPFLEASEHERAELLRDKLAKSIRPADKVGVGRFESVLSEVGFGGGVDPEVRKGLLELSEVRHLIVHRQGTVDHKFADRCPWVEIAVGNPYPVNAKRYRRFYVSAFWYLMELAIRWLEAHENQELASEYRQTQQDMASAVTGNAESPSAEE